LSDPEAVASFAALFPRLLEGATPPIDAVRAAFDAILAGAWTPVQVGAFAAVLRARGESTEAIVAGARALRAAMAAVEVDAFDAQTSPHGAAGSEWVLDTCGTGGDSSHSLNISTAAAIVTAACGVRVAKHGNRSVSSRCGSADVIEALGIPIDVPVHLQAGILSAARIAFLFAPAHHPALRHAAEARRELGVRTIFNALGPLANPARATHQLLGVYDDALRPVFARALGALGVTGAWVVRGEDGLDEVSPCAPTRVSELGADGEVTERVIAPEDFGLPRLDPAAVKGGDAADNAAAIVAILRGEPHRARDAVVLNAAAALCLVGKASPREAAERAQQALASGDAWRVLERWRLAATGAKP
jgi:anthranilate phosphoribosyltransferase